MRTSRSLLANFGLSAILSLPAMALALHAALDPGDITEIGLGALLRLGGAGAGAGLPRLIELGPSGLSTLLRWPLLPGEGPLDPIVLGVSSLLALRAALLVAPAATLAEHLLLGRRPTSARRRFEIRLLLVFVLLGFLLALSPLPRLGWLLFGGSGGGLLLLVRAWPQRAPALLGAGVIAMLALLGALPLGARGRLPPGSRGGAEVEAHRIIRHPDAPPAKQRLGADWHLPETTRSPTAQQVIVIVVDTLRADHVSILSGGRQTTPTLDRIFSREGVVFEQAYSAAPWTLPSTTSLFTSLYPSQHGVEDNNHKLSPEVQTLAGAFAAQGVLTAAFVTHIYASSRFGLDSGFNEFHELAIDWGFGEGHQLRAGAVVARLLPWLRAHQDEPFFLYLHLFDPHWDYDPPPPFDRRFTDPAYRGPIDGSMHSLQPFLPRDRRLPPGGLQRVIDLYDGEIAYTDAQLARLFEGLRALSLWEDAAIFFLSDHGEEFEEHGTIGHIRTLFEELIHIPLLFKPPGGRAADERARVGATVRSIDLAPTALEVAGLRIPPDFEGRSLLPLLETRTSPRNRPVFAQVRRRDLDLASLRLGPLKLLRDGRNSRKPVALYDLSADTAERRSIEAERPGDLARLHTALLSFEARLEAQAREAGADVELSPEEEAALRALGYVQ